MMDANEMKLAKSAGVWVSWLSTIVAWILALTAFSLAVFVGTMVLALPWVIMCGWTGWCL